MKLKDSQASTFFKTIQILICNIIEIKEQLEETNLS
jgi:hypothetical protein